MLPGASLQAVVGREENFRENLKTKKKKKLKVKVKVQKPILRPLCEAIAARIVTYFFKTPKKKETKETKGRCFQKRINRKYNNRIPEGFPMT